MRRINAAPSGPRPRRRFAIERNRADLDDEAAADTLRDVAQFADKRETMLISGHLTIYGP